MKPEIRRTFGRRLLFEPVPACQNPKNIEARRNGEATDLPMYLNRQIFQGPATIF
jgi:hypothetical protein